MHRIFAMLLDLVFPPSKDELLVRGLEMRDMEPLLSLQIRKETAILMRYRDHRVRALIWQLKYRRDRHACALLAHALRMHLDKAVHEDTIILPVPLSPRRMRERGYNQVAMVAREALDGIPRMRLCDDILVRIEHRERQTKLSRLDRIRNLRGVFDLRHPERIHGRNVILLDDVTTTGATLREAEKAVLKAGPASVIKIAMAG
jgi:ComF family protein